MAQPVFHTPTVLSNNDLQRIAPSIFAEEPYEGMSDKYSFIPTIEVLDSLRGKGWLPVKAQETKSRNEERRGYTKHLIRLRKSDAPVLVGQVIPEIVLLNSHDGGSAYQMMLGLFRLACSNGLMVDNGMFERVSIRHTGDVIGEVGYAAKELIKVGPKVGNEVKKLQTIELTPNQQGIFAAAALDLKYERDETGKSLAPIRPEQLLQIRRHEDHSNDLWTTFNVIQENMIRGGIRGRSQGESHRRHRTRGVNSVGEDVRLNRALWTLTQAMRKEAR